MTRHLQNSQKDKRDECADPNTASFVERICGPKAICKDEAAGFSCSCSDGHFAIADKAISYCADVDECASGVAGCDSVNGFCVDWNPPVKFKCGCNPGYVCTNTQCTRCAIDTAHVCNSNNGGCSSNADCIRHPNNQRSCACKDGFEGDGITCTATTALQAGEGVEEVDVVECTPTTCPDSSTCSISGGATVCTCKDGFFQISAGGTCIDIDECRTEGLSTCSGGGSSVCTNTPGSYRCQCATGYIDYAHKLIGTDCRTKEEVEAALSTGNIINYNTGLDGINAADFRPGSLALQLYINATAAIAGVPPSDIYIFGQWRHVQRESQSEASNFDSRIKWKVLSFQT